MIPYISATTINLGPIPIQVWGFFVALGIVVATWVAARRAKGKGLSAAVVWDLAGWILPSAFVGARIFHAVAYEPLRYFAHPLEIFAVWDGGFSFIGGLLAGAAVGIWFLRRRSLNVWQYADAIAFGLPIGYALGRIGCFLIHDHPGISTTFFLGARYPDGVIRHDLGLYELLNGLGLAIFFWFFQKKERRPGMFAAAALLWYGIARFFFDFLRVADVRYFFLTPAQWVSIAMVVAGIFIMRLHTKPTETIL